MINYWRNLFNKDDKSNPIDFEFEGNIKFVLKIKDLTIGYLYVEQGTWIFYYSDDFKQQTKYARLTGFSDLEKTYKSEILWPFFKIRIPGLKQPMIRDIIKSENLDEENEAVLLKRFGRRSMSNPYILEVS